MTVRVNKMNDMNRFDGLMCIILEHYMLYRGEAHAVELSVKVKGVNVGHP